MADADLEEIRRARLQQLRQQQGSPSGGGEGSQEDTQRQREAEARTSLLSQLLTPDAADRLGRIRMVKESRATAVENHLISLARSGQLRNKVTEEQLKGLLSNVAEQQEEHEAKIVVTRKGRGGGWDDDDLDDLLEGV